MINHAAPVRESLIDVPKPVAASIVSAVYDIGDYMKEEMVRLNLISGNYKSGLFWSKLNTNVNQAVGSSGGFSIIIRAGFHEFLFIEQDGFRLTFMRESRFRDVKAEVKTKGKMSYQNLLVQQYNSGLEAEVTQVSFFPMQEYDEAEISERFNKLFGKVKESDVSAGYYVMVIFDIDSTYDLHKIKAVIVDPNFDTVEEQDWSHLIPVKEPAIVEKVSNAASPSNNPSRGLSLRPKAFERRLQQEVLPSEDDEDSE